MSQTGFTPIQLYRTATASAVPLAANLVVGELAINYTDGKLFYEDNLGVVQTIASKDAAAGNFVNLTYTGTLTGGTGVVNIGSGQIFKDAAGNVGVGTATPAGSLTVNKVNLTNGTIFLNGATTGADFMRLKNTNADGIFGIAGAGGGEILTGGSAFATQIYTTGATSLQLGTNSNARLTLDSAGNAALGGVPSDWGSVNRALQFGQTAAIWTAGSNDTRLTSNAYRNASNAQIYIANGFAQTYAQVSDGSHSWFTAPSGTAGNPITFTQAATLFQSGNYVLGSTTDSGAKLKVNPTLNEGFEVTTGNQVNSTRLFSRNNAGAAVPFEYQAAEQRWYNGAGSQNMTLFSAGQLLLGATSLSTGAFAEFTSTTGALIVPRMTTAQRDAIGAVANGAIIYNTTTNKMNFRENGAWVQPTVTAA